MRVAHRNAPDYGICGLLELLANFWQNGFLMTSPLEGESENRRVERLEPPTSPLSGGFKVLYV